MTNESKSKSGSHVKVVPAAEDVAVGSGVALLELLERAVERRQSAAPVVRGLHLRRRLQASREARVVGQVQHLQTHQNEEFNTTK